MTTETKKKEFDRLMDAFRTEWFIYQDNQDSPRNINQINTMNRENGRSVLCNCNMEKIIHNNIYLATLY